MTIANSFLAGVVVGAVLAWLLAEVFDRWDAWRRRHPLAPWYRAFLGSSHRRRRR